MVLPFAIVRRVMPGQISIVGFSRFILRVCWFSISSFLIRPASVTPRSVSANTRFDAEAALRSVLRSAILEGTADSLALLYKLRDRPIFLAELSDAELVVVNAADRTVDQPGAEHDQTKVQEQQRHQQWHHGPNIVIA